MSANPLLPLPTTTMHAAQSFEDNRLSRVISPSHILSTLTLTDSSLIHTQDICTLPLPPTSLHIDSKLLFVCTPSKLSTFDHFGNQKKTSSDRTIDCAIARSHENFFLVSITTNGLLSVDDGGTKTQCQVFEKGVVIAMEWVKIGRSLIVLDNSGVGYLVKLTKTLSVTMSQGIGYVWGVEKRLLLDGKAYGAVVDVAPVRLSEEITGVCLSVFKATLCVKVDPHTRIVYRWGLPELAVREGSREDVIEDVVIRTSLAFYGNANVAVFATPGPTLARCAGRVLEFARFDSLFESVQAVSGQAYLSNTMILKCEWISDSLIALLDDAYQLAVFDTTTKTIPAKCDLSRVQIVTTQITPNYNSYQNSIRVWVDTATTAGTTAATAAATAEEEFSMVGKNHPLFLLGLTEIVRVTVQPWNVRVDKFVKSGQWLEALGLALKFYHSTLEPLEGGSGNSDAVKSSGLMLAIREGTRIAELLEKYLDFQSQLGVFNQDVAAVCIEYACDIKRLDLIYDDVYEIFSAFDKEEDLVQALYPFLASGKIADPFMSPRVFNRLVEFLAKTGESNMYLDLEVLFLTLKTVPADLDGSIRTCREKRLISALCRLYNDGLNDFTSPIKASLTWLDDVLIRDPETEEPLLLLGYRVLLYLSYCFLGLEFPRGSVPLSRERTETAKSSLLSYLFSLQPTDELHALRKFLMFDCGAFLKVVENVHGSDDANRVPRALLRVIAGDSAAFTEPIKSQVFNFVARWVATLPRRSNSAEENSLMAVLDSESSAKALFGGCACNQKLALDLIERFPRDVDLYAAVFLQLRIEDDAAWTLLGRLKLKAFDDTTASVVSSVEAQTLFEITLGRLIKNDDANLAFDFISEQRSKFIKNAWFAESVSRRALDLIRLNPEKASVLLFEIQPNAEKLLDALALDRKAQFALLKPIVGARAFGQEVTLIMVEAFVKLLCEQAPEEAYEWLSKNEGRYPLDAALEACRARNVDDAAAYLLERAGRVDEALDLVLRDVASMRGSREGNQDGNREGIHDGNRDGNRDMDRLERNCKVVINLCASFPQKQKGDQDATWFRVLDVFLDSAAELSGGELADQDRLMGVVETVVDAVVRHARVDRTLERLSFRDSAKDAAASSRFRKAILGMLESYKKQVATVRGARRALQQDLNTIESRRRSEHARGVRVIMGEGGGVRLGRRGFVASGTQPRISGFDDFDEIEECFAALEQDPADESGNNRLARALLLGTEFQVRLMPDFYDENTFQAGYELRPELVDAGL